MVGRFADGADEGSVLCAPFQARAAEKVTPGIRRIA